MPMTPRERWMAIFNRETPDRLPADYWATGEFHNKLKAHLGLGDDNAVWETLGIDRPTWASPRWKLKHHPDDPSADMWGIRHVSADYGTGTYWETSGHPLREATTVAQVESFRWPSPDDWDYSTVAESLKRNNGRRIVNGGGYEPFLTYCAIRGMEQAYMDLVESPEIVDAIMGRLFAFHYEHNRRMWEAAQGGIDVMYLAEDLGGQTAPLFSLETYRRFILPGQTKMAALAKTYGIKVFYHTDGSARPFLPDLIDVVGIDLLNPIQWRCPGMEIDGLVRDYGSKIAFHGGIDNQQTLPFGTPAEVAEQVHDCARKFAGHRWICAPCHNIQSLTPVENVVAMYRAAAEVKL